jgi:hypothetical protein
MAGGWTRDGAVQEQIDDTVTDAVKRARARLAAGEGETHCERCGEDPGSQAPCPARCPDLRALPVGARWPPGGLVDQPPGQQGQPVALAAASLRGVLKA